MFFFASGIATSKAVFSNIPIAGTINKNQAK
jgi:hypothetical protein